MKKIFLLFTVVLTGCSASKEFKQLQWSPGDNIEDLKFINDIEQSFPEQNSVLDEQIEFTSQQYAGIEIENTFVKKINHKEGALLSVAARYKEPDKIFSKLDTQSFKQNVKIKAAVAKKFPFLRSADLKTLKPVIDGNNRLVWQVLYFKGNAVPRLLKLTKDLELVSDTRAGADWFDRSAFIYPTGPKLGPLKEVPLKNLSFSPPLSNPLYTITSSITGLFDEAESVLNFSPADSRFDQVQVYYYVGQVLKFSKEILGVEIKIPLSIQLQVGFPEKTNAAFYYNGKIRLGAGDDVYYSRIPQDPSIVSHEVFHALVETLARLPYEGEGGSLNEAFADYFTSQLLGRPHLGDTAFLQGPYKRSLENDKKWQDKAGALYGDSLIVSGLLWSLGKKIPPEKIQRVALKTLIHLNPLSDFSDFNRQCRLALAQYLEKDELEVAHKILAERGFPE